MAHGSATGAAFAAAGAAPAAPADMVVPTPGDSDSIQTLAWSPVANFLAAGSWDSKVRVWEVGDTGAAPKVELPVDGPVLDAKWNEDGSQIFAASLNGVKRWALASNATQDVAKHDAPIRCVSWMPESQGLITGSWDRTVKLWDCRVAPGPAAMSLPMPERVYAMDVRGRALIVATADRSILFYDLQNPSAPFRTMVSPLKMQTRTIRIFPTVEHFAIGSIEGRVSVRGISEAFDMATLPTDPSKFVNAFAFKCHRIDTRIFAVNCIDVSPLKGYDSVFATVGSDGTYAFWDKKNKARLSEYAPSVATAQPITACAFNFNGHLFGYSCSYDWSRGAEGAPRVPNQIFVHRMQEVDIKGSPTAR